MKKKIILTLTIVLLFIVAIIVAGYMYYKQYIKELSNNISLDTEKYLASVEIKSKSNFIIYINKDKKISNIIYLNKESVNALYKQKIENNSIDKGIQLIVENLKAKDEFNSENTTFQLINYENNNLYNQIKEEFNKEFVIYGINKSIEEGSTTINDKLSSLNLEVNKDTKKNIKKLYDYSLNIVSSYLNHDDDGEVVVEKENMDQYANNIYNKLITYSAGITQQNKDDIKGIDISTINATSDYENQLYADKSSWYYIEEGKVYAYIKFIYEDKPYEYCYPGNKGFSKGVCQ